MKLLKKISLIAFIISAQFFLSSCSNSEGSEVKKETESDEQAAYVEIEKLQHQNFEEYISVIGVVKAKHKADLGSIEGGRIAEFRKDKGNYVNQGEVIIVIDNEVLKANLDAAKAQFDLAEMNYQKQEKIYKENVTSEMQYLKAKYDRDAAKANYELVKSRYEKTFIKAPFSGVVDAKFIEEGEIAPPGAPIVTLVSINQIKVTAGVPENYINEVKVGNKVKVEFNELENSEYSEKISFVGNMISPDNRTFPIEINMNNRNKTIKPELNAVVKILKQSYDKAIIIPEEVITKTDLGDAVFVEENGVAKMKIVEIISRYNNMAAIKEGLKEGDKLILIGYQNLIDGEKVKVVN